VPATPLALRMRNRMREALKEADFKLYCTIKAKARLVTCPSIALGPTHKVPVPLSHKCAPDYKNNLIIKTH
jgi:hypothetical protein